MSRIRTAFRNEVWSTAWCKSCGASILPDDVVTCAVLRVFKSIFTPDFLRALLHIESKDCPYREGTIGSRPGGGDGVETGYPRRGCCKPRADRLDRGEDPASVFNGGQEVREASQIFGRPRATR